MHDPIFFFSFFFPIQMKHNEMIIYIFLNRLKDRIIQGPGCEATPLKAAFFRLDQVWLPTERVIYLFFLSRKRRDMQCVSLKLRCPLCTWCTPQLTAPL